MANSWNFINSNFEDETRVYNRLPRVVVNIWDDKILDTIRTFLRTDFAGNMAIYTGNFKDMGNQSIRLNPVRCELIQQLSAGEIREYELDISYTFKENNVKRDAWEHILRQVSTIEAVFYENRNNTFFNGRLEECRINEKETAEEAVEGLNVMRWTWKGMFLGNIS
jgi:hypothetical protein